MSDFPDSTQHVSPAAASLIENFQKKNGTSAASTANSISTNTARQNFLNSNASLSSSVKETSTSSQVSFFFAIILFGFFIDDSWMAWWEGICHLVSV